MLDKLQAIKERFDAIAEQLQEPEVISDMKRYIKLNKEYKDLETIVEAYLKYRDILSNIENTKNILRTDNDDDMREMAKLEITELEMKNAEMEEYIKELLIPKDPEDDKNAIVEVRAGTGGDEAGIFAGDLYRMYLRFCDIKGWKAELLNENESSSGGYKEISIQISGEGVYGLLKYESGVHRVQRVPETESQGRVHTSAASVAVLPEADEVDVDINPVDIKVDTFRASGAGGQHVNKTESAIRLTHMPTGVVVECQSERSQIRNRESAMTMLRTKIYEMEYQKHMAEIAKKRKTMVSTGDRSAKIRTYNFPQGRVTDHRIGLTLYNLPEVMNGSIEDIINALQVAENAEKLKAGIE